MTTKLTVEFHDQSPTLITNPGAEYQTASRLWQGIPGIERAPNGRLWATWYTGEKGEGPGNYVVLVTSEDDGQTWTEPVLVAAPPEKARCYDPVLWHAPDSRLWLFWAQSERNHYDGRAGVWASVTDGSTRADCKWSEPKRLCNGIMMNKPVVLSTGEWVLPAAVWSHNTPFVELDKERYSNMVVSTDRGETWSIRGGADVPGRHFDEHHIVERGDGSLWMLVRTSGIGESVSTDRGVTWSLGKETSLGGPGSRFFIRRLRSGRLLLVNHHGFEPGLSPNTRSRSHLKAFVSEDDGNSWVGGFLIDERPGISYPDGVEDEDGTIYIIYDRNRGDGSHTLGKEGEILMAIFTEEDVLAGKSVSDKVRLRVVVNALSLA